MKIVVTIKLVPDPNAEKRIDPQTKRLVRTGVETVLNPYDEYALEAALQLKERAGGDTTVTIFSMAPDIVEGSACAKRSRWVPTTRWCSATPALEGSDVSATAYAMAAALRKLTFDLLFVGGLTDDSSTGAVPGALAEHLGLPCVTNARKAEIEGDAIEVERETDSGYQTVHGPLPALLTTALTFGEPRYASLKGIMGAKKKSDRFDLARRSRARPPGGHERLQNRSAQFRAARRVRGKGQVVEAADGADGRAGDLRFSCREEGWSEREKRHRLRRTPARRDSQSHLRAGQRGRARSPPRSAGKRTPSSWDRVGALGRAAEKLSARRRYSVNEDVDVEAFLLDPIVDYLEAAAGWPARR